MTSMFPEFRKRGNGPLSQMTVVARLDGRMNSSYAVREAMDTPADIFNGYRPRLFGIAYQMLGSRADAEDILQGSHLLD